MIYQYRVLPCPNFARTDINLIQQYGFLSYPYFIDNGFKTKDGMDWNKAINNAKLYRPLFFIANDDDWFKDKDILRQYCANIIYPVHELRDCRININGYYGFPNNPKLRDYEIEDFLLATETKKRWWLGLHDYPVKVPEYILDFHGFDSTMPELYAGKYGKIWLDWRQSKKNSNQLHWRILFEQNIQNFDLFLRGLETKLVLDAFL